MFCGVRPDEVKRTELTRLNLDAGTLRIAAKAAKTAKTRVLELSPVAVAWFRLWLKAVPNPTFNPPNFRKRWDSVREGAGLLEKWEHDVLRHTYASMAYAMHQNAAKLKAELGHSQSEETLFSHYRAAETVSGETITRAMAEQFWSLTPNAQQTI